MSFLRKKIKKTILEGLLKEKEEETKRINKKIDLPSDLQKIADRFEKNGYELYLVGGAVRDALQGKKPKDLDVATDALPNEIINILQDDHKVIETGREFNIINVVTPQGNEYEIASFRSDVSKGRRPSVKSASIEDDIMRRDLTINALFYDLNKEEIIDMVGGYEDLKKGTVRTVGDADERFEEDPLRKLRTIRFAAVSNNEIDEETSKSIKKDNDLSDISEERIREEFIKGIEKSVSTEYFLSLLDRYNMFQYILGELKISRDLGIISDDHIVVISSLVKENDTKKIRSVLNQKKYQNQEIKNITFLVSLYDLNIEENIYELKKLQQKSILSNDQIKEFGENNNMDTSLLKKFLEFELSVSGEDAMEKGLSGEEIGKEIKRREKELFSKWI